MARSAPRAILVVALVAVVAGCADKKSDERADRPREAQPAQEKQQPAQSPEQQPAPSQAPPSQPPPRSTPDEPAAPAPKPVPPRATPQRPAQGPGPTSTPPAAPPPESSARPKPEATQPEPVRPPEPKPSEPQAVPAKPGRQASRVVKDAAVLTGAPMGGVRLEHKLHAARANDNCATCHHPSKPEKPAAAEQQACSDCHTKVATPPMKTKYQAAFHNPTAQSGTCVDCHKVENAKGKKAPLKCAECHKKENR